MTEYDPQPGREMPPDLRVPGQDDADEHDLFGALQGLAGLVADVEDLDAVLAEVAGFAVASTPGAEGAGASLIRPADGPPTVLAWSVTDPFVHEIDRLQYEVCGEGPCLTAMQTARVLVSGSLGSDPRWPRFGGRVARLGVHSALSLPLVIRDQTLGALNIYSHERDAFTEHAVHLAEQFARPAAVLLTNARALHLARAKTTQLQAALGSRAVIDQAIGIVRSRSGGTADEAFDRLRQMSQGDNVKLSVVAERLVEEAVRRVHARRAGPDSS